MFPVHRREPKNAVKMHSVTLSMKREETPVDNMLYKYCNKADINVACS